jgi:hypothetical protein
MRRRWFQLHLLTCIVAMLLAAALLWVNLAPTRKVYVNGWEAVTSAETGKPAMRVDVIVDAEIGYPKPFYVERRVASKRLLTTASFSPVGNDPRTKLRLRELNDDEKSALKGFPGTDEETRAWHAALDYSGFIVWNHFWRDLGMALAIMLGAVGLCEVILRYHARGVPVAVESIQAERV